MVAYAFHPRKRFAAGAKPRKADRLRPPPSAALIDAVLAHADLRDQLGGGRVLLRLSPARIAQVGLRHTLGTEASRLSEVAVIWDERDDVIFRVLDGAPPALSVVTTPQAEARFQLTPAALDYIAQSQSRGCS